MNSTRKKMLERIRAMLNTEGRTEAEMMAFLAKARELMATYEIDEKELEAEAEKATIYRTAVADPYEIKRNLRASVGGFTRCLSWYSKTGIAFAGMDGDVIFATWLLDTLQRFVMRELRNYQKKRTMDKMPNSNHTSTSFVIGCVARIDEKLKELTISMPTKNKEIIEAHLAKNGLKLYTGKRNMNEVNPHAASSGHAAGNSARFDRPVEAGGRRMLK